MTNESAVMEIDSFYAFLINNPTCCSSLWSNYCDELVLDIVDPNFVDMLFSFDRAFPGYLDSELETWVEVFIKRRLMPLTH